MEKAIKKIVFSQETNKTQLRILNKIQNKINKQLTCVVGFGGLEEIRNIIVNGKNESEECEKGHRDRLV